VRACEECGEEFEGRSTFCSKRCRNRSYFKAHRDELLRQKQERRVYKRRS
jgi:hypothetical protein